MSSKSPAVRTANDAAICIAAAASDALGGNTPLPESMRLDWYAAIKEGGIELAGDGAFTIDLESGQQFHVRVVETRPAGFNP